MHYSCHKNSNQLNTCRGIFVYRNCHLSDAIEHGNKNDITFGRKAQICDKYLLLAFFPCLITFHYLFWIHVNITSLHTRARTHRITSHNIHPGPIRRFVKFNTHSKPELDAEFANIYINNRFITLQLHSHSHFARRFFH